MKVKADFFDSVKQKVTQRMQYAPFTWVPTEVALWYAGGDAICTWLLWEKMHDLAWSRRLVHRIDHEMVETLTWLERQRFLVDVAHHSRTVKWHTAMLKGMEIELREIALRDGYKERKDEDTGEVREEDQFNPSSNPQLAKLLFEVKKFKPVRMGKELPSVDADTQTELRKQHPEDEFLKKLIKYKEYVALHPANLRFDPDDHSARIYLKQNVVAGGRLSGAGGEFEVDGGFGLNPQGVVRVEGNWWVRGNVLEPDTVPVDEVQEYTEADLHPSCFHEKDGKVSKAPGIIKNHIGQYSGYAVCLVPKCKTCAEKYGVLIHNGRLDANQVVNIRSMFVAPKGWTFFVIDYSNIEMRAAANISGEPEFIKEFLEGKGDFHALTASKVFPEFNDPNTPKDVKKKLRSLAKIINFALLYGGTQYAIFENMKLEKPDITFKEAERMVQDYWKGVPVFAEWCNNKQKIAREQMTCSTTTGRVVDFASAMEAQSIHKPTKQELDNYWYHRRLVKKAEELEKAKDPDMETVAKLKAKASMLWKDPESGVRNAGDYNHFTGKIQRVATNIPIQGLCGDFMRIALNRIRQWAEKFQAVESVLRLYLTVHDEIDFAVKNEYAPFVVPRISRLMKLRKYHKSMKWRVPIECDCEYGTSWDVEHHLTGDDGHKPAGWTAIPGMENYIPTEFKSEEVHFWLHALISGEEGRIAGVKAELRVRLHERAYIAFELGDSKNPKKALIAALQLHEYWMTDNIPDEGEDKMETLEQYEARMGLTPADRDVMPEMGFLGAVPQTKVKRPTLQILGEEVPAEDVTITVSGTEMRVEAPKKKKETKVNQVDEDDVFGVPANRKTGAISLETLVEGYVAATPPPRSVVETVPVPDGVPELIEMDQVALQNLQKVLGVGRKKLTVRYQGKIFTIPDVALETLPKEYVKS
jgi:DNA polymerase I-like protein with 3'-5' exonuclease and polymerase domains